MIDVVPRRWQRVALPLVAVIICLGVLVELEPWRLAGAGGCAAGGLSGTRPSSRTCSDFDRYRGCRDRGNIWLGEFVAAVDQRTRRRSGQLRRHRRCHAYEVTDAELFGRRAPCPLAGSHQYVDRPFLAWRWAGQLCGSLRIVPASVLAGRAGPRTQCLPERGRRVQACWGC